MNLQRVYAEWIAGKITASAAVYLVAGGDRENLIRKFEARVRELGLMAGDDDPSPWDYDTRCTAIDIVLRERTPWAEVIESL